MASGAGFAIATRSRRPENVVHGTEVTCHGTNNSNQSTESERQNSGADMMLPKRRDHYLDAPDTWRLWDANLGRAHKWAAARAGQ